MKKRFLPLVLSVAGVTACGPGATSAQHPLAKTLDYIRANGFPKLSDLLPSMPPQLARITGVETDATGMPMVPDNLLGIDLAGDGADLSAALTEARELAAQGFSETRRIEATLEGLAAPVYDVLGQSDVFQAVGDALSGGKTLIQTGSGTAAKSGVNVFDELLNELEYAVETGGTGGMPSHLLLRGDRAAGGIRIAGLWPDGSDYVSGFDALVRLDGADDFAVTLTFSPARVTSFVSAWKKASCTDDLWQFSVVASPEGDKKLGVASLECPSTRNSVASLGFAQDGAGVWKLTGGFAQSYPDAQDGTLRGFLGKRQGVVLQAASDSGLSKLAAAAAVLGESDFAEPTQAKIDQFGVGQLLGRYFQSRYFNPRNAAAKKGDIFSEASNVAYWLCVNSVSAPLVKSEVAAAKDLCNGAEIDVESVLSALTSVREAVDSVPLAPSSIKTTAKRLIDILTVRNTLFVGDGGSIAYKTPPDDPFKQLDEARKASLPSALGKTDWLAEAKAAMARFPASQLPDTPYKAIASKVTSFLGASCVALVNEAAAKAGKSGNSASVCGG